MCLRQKQNLRRAQAVLTASAASRPGSKRDIKETPGCGARPCDFSSHAQNGRRPVHGFSIEHCPLLWARHSHTFHSSQTLPGKNNLQNNGGLKKFWAVRCLFVCLTSYGSPTEQRLPQNARKKKYQQNKREERGARNLANGSLYLNENP